MNTKHLSIVGSFVLLLVLSSCVGIDAEARIAGDGSVELTMKYEVSIAVDRIGKLGANARYLPLPVSEEDLSLAATRAGGELLAWNREDRTNRFLISSRLRFPNPGSFATFLDPTGQGAGFSETSTGQRLTIQLSEGRVPADPDLVRFIQTVFEEYQISLNFILPRAPVTATGLSINGSRASFNMPAAELYASPSPVLLVLEW